MNFCKNCRILRRFPDRRIYHDNGNIGFLQNLICLFYAHFSKFPHIIQTGGINHNNRPKWQQLHCLLYRVCCCACHIRNNC